MILGGFIIYCLDGVTAMVVANVALSYHLHGTMWGWGARNDRSSFHEYDVDGSSLPPLPVITNRNPDGDSCRRSYSIFILLEVLD